MSDNAKELRLKKMMYRSWHRGCKETDLILGSFAENHLYDLSDVELDQYEALLELDDWDIYNWLTGKTPIPANIDNAIMRRLVNTSFVEENKN